MNQLSLADRHEFLKSMEVEWQALLQNQAAKVLSLEETAQAQARWVDRAMDTRRQQAIGATCQGKTHYLGFDRT